MRQGRIYNLFPIGNTTAQEGYELQAYVLPRYIHNRLNHFPFCEGTLCEVRNYQ